MKRILLAFVILALLALGGLLASLFAPYRGFIGEVYLDIPKGAGTAGMAALLADEEVIRARWQFLAVRLLRPRATLMAGEYLFSRADSVWNIYGRIARGDVFYHELRVPEGHNLFDIAHAVGQLGFIQPEEFLTAARNTALIHDLNPSAPTLEGYLFPSTYRLTRHTTADQLCRMMTDQFRRVWKELGGASAATTVTLASMVEKETAVPEERPTVAAVYRNRLEAGMPLQCDPTTIYAALLENRYQGKIFRSDLASQNAYNTYAHAGLPPGPIANPGRGSLEAALHPAASDFLYFVAKPDGSGAHRFSVNLAEHEKAVKEYRRGLRQNQQKAKGARQTE